MRLLVLGGTRSGKSAHAEQVAGSTGARVVYVATARRDADDTDFEQRIAAHRERRPGAWETVETVELVDVLRENADATVLVDDLGLWLTRRLDMTLGWTSGTADVEADVDRLVEAVRAHAGDVVLVSPEVGLGVVPESRSGRVFADLLGALNRRLAEVCDRAELVVAGRVVELGDESGPRPASRPAAAAIAGAGAAAVAGTLAATPAVADRSGGIAPSGPDSLAAAAQPPTGADPVAPAAGIPAPDTDTTAPDTADAFPGLRDVEHYADPVDFDPVRPPVHAVAEEARARQLTLTKPPGSLGRLEALGEWLAACQEQCPPHPLERPRIVVFAGDHGVAAHGVSAFPQEVTPQMVATILGGGAAVSVLARQAGATVRVADLAVAVDCPGGVGDHKVRRSSGSVDREDALDREEVRAAIAAGRRIADEEVDAGADLLVAGDLGIGNTTPATILTCLVTGKEPVELVGRGTGVDDEGWMRKTAAIRDAMYRARHDLRDPVALLRRAGGADLAAMAGFLAQAALRRTPVLLDGSVVTAAALLAEQLAPGSRQWWRAGHRSAEPAHTAALAFLALDPVVEFDMRLGEGSGAAVALPVLHSAVAILREMATFADAGVSERD